MEAHSSNLSLEQKIIVEVEKTIPRHWMTSTLINLLAKYNKVEPSTCRCPAGSYDYPNAVHAPYCPLAQK